VRAQESADTLGNITREVEQFQTAVMRQRALLEQCEVGPRAGVESARAPAVAWLCRDAPMRAAAAAQRSLSVMRNDVKAARLSRGENDAVKKSVAARCARAGWVVGGAL
jgi:hypothetical protein